MLLAFVAAARVPCHGIEHSSGRWICDSRRGSIRICLAECAVRRVRELPLPLSFLHGRLPSPEDGWASGKALRKEVPRESHAGWKPGNHRPDPVEILIASNKARIPELVPIRHGRMLSSSFAFLHGSAAVMAADLAKTAVTGVTGLQV